MTSKKGGFANQLSCLLILCLAACGGGGQSQEPDSAAKAPQIRSVTPLKMTAGISASLEARVSGSSPISYAWTFGTGVTPASSQDAAPFVLLQQPGKYGGKLTVSNDQGSDTVDFELTGTGVNISGMISSMVGEPFPGVEVSLGEGMKAVSDEEGHWQIENVPLGTYLATPGLGDSAFEPAQRLLELDAEDVNNVWFRQTGFRQTPTSWIRSWVTGNYAMDETTSIAVGSDQSLYLAAHRLVVLRYDATGELRFAKGWMQGEEAAYKARLASAPGGNLWVSGWFTDEAGTHLLLLRLSQSGTIVQQQLSEDIGSFENGAMACGEYGGVVVGWKGSSQTGREGAVTAAFNNKGEQVWARLWEHSDASNVIGVAIDESDAIYVCGNTYSYTAFHDFGSSYGGARVFLLKYRQDGELLWQRIWDRGYSTEACSMQLGPAGQVYIAAGVSDEHLAREHRGDLLLEFDPQGELVLARRILRSVFLEYGDPELDFAPSLCVLPDGSLCFGDSLVDSYDFEDLILCHLKADGRAIRQRRYLGPDGQGGPLMLPDGAGGIYIGGSAESSSGYWQNVEFNTSLVEGELSDPEAQVWETSFEFEPAQGSMVDLQGEVASSEGGYPGLLAIRTAVP